MPPPTPSRPPPQFRARAQAQAREFEAVFLTTMLNQMFSGLETDGPFHGGHAEEQFRSLMVEELGNSIAQAGGHRHCRRGRA